MKCTLPLFLMSLFISTSAFSSRIQCDRAQDTCSVKNANYTFNDKIVFINNNNEVVAVGEVKRLQGERRFIKIIKQFGRISGKDESKLMDSRVSSTDDLKKVYKVYVAKPEYLLGAGAGVTTFNVGEYLTGVEVTVYLQKKYNLYLDWVGRVVLNSANGRISKDNIGVTEQELGVTSFSLLGGATTTIFRREKASVRGEFDLGLAFVSATVGGDGSLVYDEGYNSKMKNGVGIAARAESSIQYDMSETWEFGVYLGLSHVHNATAYVVGLTSSWVL